MDGKRKILELLANGQLTTEEAKKFLDIYETYEKAKSENQDKAFKKLVIKIEDRCKNKNLVNISIPLEFIGLIKTSKIYTKLKEFDLDVDYIVNASSKGFEGTLIEIETDEHLYILVAIK